jgi:hypothetical protein
MASDAPEELVEAELSRFLGAAQLEDQQATTD